MKNLKLIFLGAPGAGKGTQSDIVAEKYGIPTISTGVMIREAIKNNTEMGLQAKAYAENGKLVPDEVVIGIIGVSLCLKSHFCIIFYSLSDHYAR